MTMTRSLFIHVKTTRIKYIQIRKEADDYGKPRWRERRFNIPLQITTSAYEEWLFAQAE